MAAGEKFFISRRPRLNFYSLKISLQELRWVGYTGGTSWRGLAEGSTSEVD